jgi:hypothetical protein
MRLTIIAGLVVGLALGIHSVLGGRARAGSLHAAATQGPHVGPAHVHRGPIYLRSTSAELEPSARPDTRFDDRLIAEADARARVRRTATAIILWTASQRP